MRISVISNSRVDESKGGLLSHVDTVVELDSLSDFGDVATNFHIAPATFKENRKKQDHLEQIQFICFDFDDGSISAKDLHDKLRLFFNHIILASKNHLKDKGDGKGIIERFHLFIPTDKPIESVEFYKYVCKLIAKMSGWSVDNNCLEPARYFYKHSAVLFIKDDGKTLDIDRLERAKKLDDLEVERQRHNSALKFAKMQKEKVPAIDRFKRTKYFRMMEKGDLRSDGNRYATSCKIIGGMITCGLDKSEMMCLFDAHSNYGESFTRDSIERRVEDWN